MLLKRFTRYRFRAGAGKHTLVIHIDDTERCPYCKLSLLLLRSPLFPLTPASEATSKNHQLWSIPISIDRVWLGGRGRRVTAISVLSAVQSRCRAVQGVRGRAAPGRVRAVVARSIPCGRRRSVGAFTCSAAGQINGSPVSVESNWRRRSVLTVVPFPSTLRRRADVQECLRHPWIEVSVLCRWWR